ncbi:MAG: class II glutamine amidotransferase [Myxococcales bacterium]|nr:class II glutamine amidotransferase [Myxococcales bacterium]USN50759.1 MAG: class II glutamine amidotransferase [Myxococcales bacterium]
MCRLFSVKARNKSKVHHSLVAAENALMEQSRKHPDGWGIAYYQQGVPHLIKCSDPAYKSEMFHHVSHALFSDTVIAHVRKATFGSISIANCHPFQQGRWVMAHNGEIPNFKKIRGDLMAAISPQFLVNILGATDSEIYCALIMQELYQLRVLDSPAPAVQLVARAVRAAVKKIEFLAGRYDIEKKTSLNIVLSNGTLLLAYRHGRELNYSCFRDDESSCTGALLANKCVPNYIEGCSISHLLISSEPVAQKDLWQSLLDRQIVAVDHEWKFYRDL